MEWIYLLLGAICASTALTLGRDAAHPSRWRSSAFFAVLALLLAAAQWLPPVLVGALVVLLIGLGGSGLRRAPDDSDPVAQAADASRFGHRLFVPALLLPLLTVAGALWFGRHPVPGFSDKQQPLLALALAAVLALLVALLQTGTHPRTLPHASTRLLDAIGWAGVLPLLLSILGALLAQAGTANALADVVRAVLPTELAWVCLLAYGLGMALLTMLIGNAFAAFPVLATAIGVPLLVVQHGADPAPLAAIGMLCGYCGTLLTPMAANFNIVPAALLDLDRHAVIRAQVATALPLLACNLGWLALLLWR